MLEGKSIKLEDEEQPDDIVNFDGNVNNCSEFKNEAWDSPSGDIAKPGMVGRRLTEVSKKYDLNDKGYLNATELALRRMDSHNDGFLDTDKVYLIMESLQNEQKQSAVLIETIRKEHKKSMSLRRGIIALGCFAVLLAVANIGTSFAAARLAKDTKVSSQYQDLVSLNGERLGTTSKEVEISMGSVTTGVTSQRRRHLEEIEALVCGTDNSDVGYICNLQGVVTFKEAVLMYQQFCQGWPNDVNNCQGGGVSQLVLNCNGVRSTIFGGNLIPGTGPTTDLLGYEYTIFPTQGRSYQARQALYLTKFVNFRNRPCMQDFEISFYCPTSGDECFIFGSFAVAQCFGSSPELCGVPPAVEE